MESKKNNPTPPSMENQKKSQPFRAGYVAIVGQPNVGKSTLLNAILQFKISVVSAKPQTTRRRILGILNQPASQIVFLDTPGILEPAYKLQKSFVRAAHSAISEADLQLFLIEPEAFLRPKDEEILKRVIETGKPVIVAINKIDKVKKQVVLPLIEKLSKNSAIKEIVPISALKNDGTDSLTSLLEQFLPTHEPFYPPDQVTNHPERFLASEIIREKIFLRYGEEIPYSTTVRVEEFVERPKRKDYIRAVIYVERDSQKGIIIGKQGNALKHIGKMAREDLESLLGRSVYLELFVSVKPKWRDRDSELRNLGYI